MAKKKKKQQGSPSSPKQQRSELVQEAFRYSARLVNQRNYDNPQLKESLDFDQIRIKRRTAAVLSTMEEVRERVLNQHPQLRDGFSVESDWAEVNAQPRPAYDGEEEMSTVSLGAAIWMLDQLKGSGRLHQETPLFPMDDGQLDDIDMPDVWDPCHSEEMLRGMLTIIQERNADCIGKRRDPAIEQNEKLLNRVFMDLHTAENTHRREVPSRARFEAILDLIPMEAKEKAASAFTDKFWEWVDRYYRCRSIYALQEIQLDKDYKDFYAKAEREAKAMAQQKQKAMNALASGFPLSMPATIPAPAYSTLPSAAHAELMRFTTQMEEGEKRLEERSQAVGDSVSDLWFYLRHQVNRSYEESIETLGKEATDIWSDFTIENPYALCFGFLYLLDNGSNLPWLYFPGINLFAWIASYLPWNGFGYDEEDDPYWEYWFDIDPQDVPEKQPIHSVSRFRIWKTGTD